MMSLTKDENTERLNELPDELRNTAIKVLQEKIGYKTRQEIFKKYNDATGVNWMPHEFFTEVKQVMIDYVCPEDELSSLSWDYYIYGLVEKAMNIAR